MHACGRLSKYLVERIYLARAEGGRDLGNLHLGLGAVVVGWVGKYLFSNSPPPCLPLPDPIYSGGYREAIPLGDMSV